jgi:hypothetical protein
MKEKLESTPIISVIWVDVDVIVLTATSATQTHNL